MDRFPDGAATVRDFTRLLTTNFSKDTATNSRTRGIITHENGRKNAQSHHTHTHTVPYSTAHTHNILHSRLQPQSKKQQLMASAIVGRQLGQAEITALADASALRLYEVYRSRKGKAPFKSMRFIEIECDNLENEIFSFARWCSSTPIPKFFQDDLQPRRQNNDAPVKLLLKATLSKYIGKVLLLIRRKCWENDKGELCQCSTRYSLEEL